MTRIQRGFGHGFGHGVDMHRDNSNHVVRLYSAHADERSLVATLASDRGIAMNEQIPKTRLRIGNSACYEILVQGALDERWSGRLSGLSVKTFEPEGGFSVTRLTGVVLDQAALLGVLNTLYELRLPLISITYIDFDDIEELV